MSESQLRELFGVVRIDVKRRRAEILEASMHEDATFWGIALIGENVAEPVMLNLATRADAELRAAELRERLGVNLRAFRCVAYLSELSAPVLSPVVKG